MFISRRLGTLALNGLWRLVSFWALPGVSDQDRRNQAATAIFPSHVNETVIPPGAKRLMAHCSLTSAGTKAQIPRLAACFPLTKVALDQGSQSCCQEFLGRVVPICGSHSMWLRWAGLRKRMGDL